MQPPHREWKSWSPWAVLMTMAVACSSSAQPTSPNPVTADAPAAGAAENNSDIELLNAGEAPRRDLRSEAVVGVHEEWLFSTQMAYENLDSRWTPEPLPPAELLLDLVLEHTEAGIRHYSLTAGLREQRTVLAEGWIDVDAWGRVVDSDILFAGQADHRAALTSPGKSLLQLRDNIDLVPKQAVGIGATWTATTEETLDGVTARTNTTYRVTGFVQDAVQIEMKGTVTAAGQSPVKRLSATTIRSVVRTPNALLSKSEASTQAEIVPEDPDKPRLRLSTTVTLRPLEDEWFGVFPEVERPDGRSPRGRPQWCKSLRGDREGMFPAETGRLQGACEGGEPTGHWVAYHDNSKTKRLEGDFDAGTPVGHWTQYDETGETLGSFELDEGTGTATTWWPNGRKRFEVDLVSGQPHGAVAAWHVDGTPRLRGHVRDGKYDGAWEEYDEAGTRIATGMFDAVCRILQVRPDSRAQAAGLRTGDVLIRIDERAVASESEIIDALVRRDDGPVRVEVQRNGKTHTFKPEVSDGRLGVQLSCGSRERHE